MTRSCPRNARRRSADQVELTELLAKADFITLHVPYTEETANIPCRAEEPRQTRGRAQRFQLRARRAGRRGPRWPS